MNVRRVRLDDVGVFRDVRLRALRADPAAFASSYATEIDRPLDTWTTWVALSAQGPDQAMFLAEDGDEVIGLAGAFRLEDHPRTMHLIAMWVEPAHRRRGVGQQLTAAIVTWARSADADTVMLWVVDHNEAADKLYRQAGFEPTGVSQPLPSNPDLVEHQMALSLGTRLRMPDGYVELDPMTKSEIRAFMEWVIADRTARLMDSDALAIDEAADRVRIRVSSLIDGPPGTSHRFFTLKAGAEADSLGWLWMSESRRSGARIGTIEELVVFEDFRGRGLGVSAVDSAILTMLDDGITTLEGSIPTGHSRAIAVAESCGFIEVRRTNTEITMRLDIPASGR